MLITLESGRVNQLASNIVNTHLEVTPLGSLQALRVGRKQRRTDESRIEKTTRLTPPKNTDLARNQGLAARKNCAS